MTVDQELNGEAAKVRLTSQYQTAVDELIAGLDPEYSYTTLDGERVNEYILVGRLLARAGAAWVCIHDGCHCINHNSNSSCDNCGRRRPPRKSVPKIERF